MICGYGSYFPIDEFIIFGNMWRSVWTAEWCKRLTGLAIIIWSNRLFISAATN